MPFKYHKKKGGARVVLGMDVNGEGSKCYVVLLGPSKEELCISLGPAALQWRQGVEHYDIVLDGNLSCFYADIDVRWLRHIRIYTIKHHTQRQLDWDQALSAAGGWDQGRVERSHRWLRGGRYGGFRLVQRDQEVPSTCTAGGSAHPHPR